MVLATQLATLSCTFSSSHNLGVFISIKELKFLLINPSSVVSWCLPMSILNTKSWSSPIYWILLKYDYLGLGVMVAISFSVKTLNQLCIFSIADLSISRANRWRVVCMLNYFMACNIYSFNKCKYDKVTIPSSICSTKDFWKPFISSNSFELSSDNTLLATMTICNSASTCLTFWPSIIVA